MIFIPFVPEHLYFLKIQESQADFLDWKGSLPPEILGESWSAFKGAECLAVGGFVEMKGKPTIWALFSQNLKPATLTRVIIFIMKHVRSKKEVIYPVHPTDPKSPRLAKIMGFCYAGEQEGYSLDGSLTPVYIRSK